MSKLLKIQMKSQELSYPICMPNINKSKLIYICQFFKFTTLSFYLESFLTYKTI